MPRFKVCLIVGGVTFLKCVHHRFTFDYVVELTLHVLGILTDDANYLSNNAQVKSKPTYWRQNEVPNTLFRFDKKLFKNSCQVTFFYFLLTATIYTKVKKH